MKKRKVTRNNRNSQVLGNNSKSYNDKHPSNPIVLRPIRDAIKNTPKVKDAKGNQHTDYKRIAFLRSLGSAGYGKQAIMEVAAQSSSAD